MTHRVSLSQIVTAENPGNYSYYHGYDKPKPSRGMATRTPAPLLDWHEIRVRKHECEETCTGFDKDKGGCHWKYLGDCREELG